MGLPEILMFESLNPPSPLLNGQYLFSPPHDHGDVADLDTDGLGSGNTKYRDGSTGPNCSLSRT